MLGNMSLRMEDAENRLITEPAPIGSDRLEGQKCKYAEKSYMYKYDLGHMLSRCLRLLLFLKKSSCTERERDRRVWRRKRTRGCRCLCVSLTLYSSPIVLSLQPVGCRGFPHHSGFSTLNILFLLFTLVFYLCIHTEFGCGRTKK